MPFSEILGQEKATDYLKTLVQNDRVPGAFLFYGPAGVGKAKTALEFAKALNCLDAASRTQGEACGMCANCLAIEKQTHPDVVFADFLYQARLTVKKEFESGSYEEELEKELARQQHINIDTIRHITTKAQQKSVGNGYKVFIIDEAQTMQGPAANALLKFIEEPPARTVWILITSKRAAMLRTILSRCQALAFSPLSQENVKRILQSNELDTQFPNLSATYSCGSVQGALKADGALALLQEAGLSATGCSPQGPAAVVAELPRTLVAARQETQAALDVLMLALHNAWIAAPTNNEQRRYARALQQFESYKRSLTRNVSPALVLETALCSLDGLNLPLFETEN